MITPISYSCKKGLVLCRIARSLIRPFLEPSEISEVFPKKLPGLSVSRERLSPGGVLGEGRRLLAEEEAVEGVGDAVFVVGLGDEVRLLTDVFGGIAHGDTHTSELDHL
mgnify:CR=1 FL=1